MPDTNQIEKKILLRAPRARVWRAISKAAEFGEWFRVKFVGEFAEGATIRGNITYPGYEHVTMDIFVERIAPQEYFAYRWHPYAVNSAVDYSAEPMTLVEFRLDEGEGGTLLTITESGFDCIPTKRRARGPQDERGRLDPAVAQHRTPCLEGIARRRGGSPGPRRYLPRWAIRRACAWWRG